MKEVYIVADNIFSPLGKTTTENFSKLVNNISSVKQQENISIADEAFYASLFDSRTNFIEDPDKNHYTKFEQLLIASISEALSRADIDPSDKKTLLII